MPGRTRGDENGLVGVVLTIVIVWALIAVVMLTRTLEAAQSIDTTVIGIEGSVKSANSHLNTGCNTSTNENCPTDALPVLNTTIAEVAEIKKAADPLSGEAGTILDTVHSINTTASSILNSASSINSTVHSINGHVGSINSDVHSISGSLSGVNGDVMTIQHLIVTINGQAASIVTTVAAIKGDTGTINGQANGILTQATGICKTPILVGDKC